MGTTINWYTIGEVETPFDLTFTEGDSVDINLGISTYEWDHAGDHEQLDQIVIDSSKLPSNLNINPDNNFFNINGDAIVPPLFYEYVIDGELIRTVDFIDIPDTIETAVRMEPDQITSELYNVLVIATFSQNGNLSRDVKRNYAITIINTWSGDKTAVAALKAKEA